MEEKDKKEMRFYETLGIKKFRKFVFKLRYLISIPITKGMTEEERKELLLNSSDNYTIGNANNIENVKKYKKNIYLNTFLHILGSIICIIWIQIPGQGISIIIDHILLTIFLLINSYCIMLQRYNCIKINYTIKRMTLRNEKRNKFDKEKIEEIAPNLTRNNNKEEEKIVQSDILDNYSLAEFKQHNSSLERLQESLKGQENSSTRTDDVINIDKQNDNKVLTLRSK